MKCKEARGGGERTKSLPVMEGRRTRKKKPQIIFFNKHLQQTKKREPKKKKKKQKITYLVILKNTIK